MKHARLALLGTIIIGAIITINSTLAQSGWRSTITGINLPLTTARIADARILAAAAKALEAVARENALSGRCRGTEIIQYDNKNRDTFIDSIEQDLMTQGFVLENLPGGDGNSYSLAARQGSRLVVLNVNLLEDGRALIAWCALEPVVQQVAPPPAPKPPKPIPPASIVTGRYNCQYVLASGNLVRPGTIQIVSSSTYRFFDDRTAHKYAYDPKSGRITWRSGPLANQNAYRETHLELDVGNRAHIYIMVRTAAGIFKWDCLRQG
jgi:hypothetical protein